MRQTTSARTRTCRSAEQSAARTACASCDRCCAASSLSHFSLSRPSPASVLPAMAARSAAAAAAAAARLSLIVFSPALRALISCRRCWPSLTCSLSRNSCTRVHPGQTGTIVTSDVLNMRMYIASCLQDVWRKHLNPCTCCAVLASGSSTGSSSTPVCGREGRPRLAAHLHVSCIGPHFCQGGIDFRPELSLTRLNRGVAGRHRRRHLGQACNRGRGGGGAAAVHCQLGIVMCLLRSAQHSLCSTFPGFWALMEPEGCRAGTRNKELSFWGCQKTRAPSQQRSPRPGLCNVPLFVASARAACADAAAAAKRARPPSSAAMRSAAAASLERLADSRADRLASTACLRRRRPKDANSVRQQKLSGLCPDREVDCCPNWQLLCVSKTGGQTVCLNFKQQQHR